MFLRIKYLKTDHFFQKKLNLMMQILMKYLISNITNFHQELEGGHMKDQVGLVIQYYNINFVF